MLIALGVFTYYGFRPLGRLLTNHTCRMIVSGELMGLGAVGLLAIAYRFHKNVGFTPLERLEDLGPQKIIVLDESGRQKTRLVTAQMLKEEYFSRLGIQEYFRLRTIDGYRLYVHIRDGFYYKMGDEAQPLDDGRYDCHGIICQQINNQTLTARTKTPKVMRYIDPLKELMPRLEADQSVQFGKRFYNHFIAGFYTITEKPVFPVIPLYALLGKTPYCNRKCRIVDPQKDLLPRLKDDQACNFEGKCYAHVRNGYYYVFNRERSKTVSLRNLLEQVPKLNHKLRELDLERDLIPRMEDGEYINFKDSFYLHVERGMWIKSSWLVGKKVLLHELLGREKKQKPKQLPTINQISPYLHRLRENECIYYQGAGNVWLQRAERMPHASNYEERHDLPPTMLQEASYRGKQHDFRSVSIEELKTNKRPLDRHPGGRGLDGWSNDQKRIERWKIEIEKPLSAVEIDGEGDTFDDAKKSSKTVTLEDCPLLETDGEGDTFYDAKKSSKTVTFEDCPLVETDSEG